MKVYLNDKETTIDNQSTIVDLLQRHKISDTGGMAIAVNAVVVPKTTWENHTLSDQDKITLITATAGG